MDIFRLPFTQNAWKRHAHEIEPTWYKGWNSTKESPEAISEELVLLQLNTDFSAKGLSSDELTALVSAWQTGAISRETMFDVFRRGEVLPPGRTDEEERRLVGEVQGPKSQAQWEQRRPKCSLISLVKGWRRKYCRAWKAVSQRLRHHYRSQQYLRAVDGAGFSSRWLIIPPVCFGMLVVLRLFGLLIPFGIPTSAMAPAISTGDHIIMEGFSFLARQPRRGDVVVFRADGIASLPPATYVKRIAGEPRDHVRIVGGKLFVNERPVSLSNSAGEIIYDLPLQLGIIQPRLEMTVPPGCYYVLGDNSTNSFDSRFWGCVPRSNIIGRASFCSWPPQRIQVVK